MQNLASFKKTILFSLALIMICSSARSQGAVSQIRHNIKFSPLHLINSFPTIQVAYEHNLLKKISFQLETGYVLNIETLTKDEYDNPQGWKFREEVRYYYRFKPQKSNAHYMALEFFQNYLRFDDSGPTNVCDDAQCHTWTTVELNSYRVKLHEKGFGIKMGLTEFSGRFLFDFNWGLGIRKVTWHRPFAIEPMGGGTIGLPTEYFIRDEDDHARIFPSLGLRIGYFLSKEKK